MNSNVELVLVDEPPQARGRSKYEPWLLAVRDVAERHGETPGPWARFDEPMPTTRGGSVPRDLRRYCRRHGLGRYELVCRIENNHLWLFGRWLGGSDDRRDSMEGDR